MQGFEPDRIVLDGKHDYLGMPRVVRTIVKGDQKVLSVAAASVIAKTTRDAMMADEAEHYPAYGFESNRGYPAPLHKCRARRLRTVGDPPALVDLHGLLRVGWHSALRAPAHLVLERGRCLTRVGCGRGARRRDAHAHGARVVRRRTRSRSDERRGRGLVSRLRQASGRPGGAAAAARPRRCPAASGNASTRCSGAITSTSPRIGPRCTSRCASRPSRASSSGPRSTPKCSACCNRCRSSRRRSATGAGSVTRVDRSATS